jgi:hypothetical protein
LGEDEKNSKPENRNPNEEGSSSFGFRVSDFGFSPLSPLPVRIIVYVVLVLVAILAIRLIDERAMTRMAELEQEKQHQHEPATTQPGL